MPKTWEEHSSEELLESQYQKNHLDTVTLIYSQVGERLTLNAIENNDASYYRVINVLFQI